MIGGHVVKRAWSSIPREVWFGAGQAVYLYFGQEWSAVTFFVCVASYEILRWLLERDTERVRRRLNEEYGLDLR